MQALDADDPSAPSESLVSTPCPYTLAQSDPGLRLLSAGRTLGSRVVDQTLSLAGEPNDPPNQSTHFLAGAIRRPSAPLLTICIRQNSLKKTVRARAFSSNLCLRFTTCW